MTFCYRFGYGGDVTHYPFSGGVHHSDDLIYLFPYPPNVAKLNEQDTKVSKIIVDLWTSFAINGIPELPNHENGINALTWQPFLGKFINSIFPPQFSDVYTLESFFKTGPYGSYLHIDKELSVAHDYRKEFVVSIQT